MVKTHHVFGAKCHLNRLLLGHEGKSMTLQQEDLAAASEPSAMCSVGQSDILPRDEVPCKAHSINCGMPVSKAFNLDLIEALVHTSRWQAEQGRGEQVKCHH